MDSFWISDYISKFFHCLFLLFFIYFRPSAAASYALPWKGTSVQFLYILSVPVFMLTQKCAKGNNSGTKALLFLGNMEGKMRKFHVPK